MAKWRPIKLRINPAFLLLLAAFCWFYPHETLFIILSLLAHEGCHAAVALYYGVGITRLELLPCGGKLVLDDTDKLSGGRIVAVALAGPLGSFCLALLCRDSEVLYQTNLMLCWFNLLPLLPLDGGHLLRALLKENISSHKTALVLTVISAVGSTALICLVIYTYLIRQEIELSLMIMAFFIAGEARREYLFTKYQPEQGRWKKFFRLADCGYCNGRIYLAGRDTKLLTVLNDIDSGDSGVILVVNDAMRVVRIFSELELWHELERGGSQLRFGDLIK